MLHSASLNFGLSVKVHRSECVWRAGNWGETQKHSLQLQTHTPFIWGLEEGQPRTALPWFSLLSWKSPSKGWVIALSQQDLAPGPTDPDAGKKPFDLVGHVADSGPLPSPGADGRSAWANDSPGLVLPGPRSHGRASAARSVKRNEGREAGEARRALGQRPAGAVGGPNRPASRLASQSAGAGGGLTGARAAPHSAS